MKFLSIISILLFFFSNCISQNILDTKRGFKNFVIGDNKSKYGSNLDYYKTTSKGDVGYIYKPQSITETYVFNCKFDKILLFFDKSDKLVTINLVKEYDKDSYSIATEEIREIIEKLSGMFGLFTEKYKNEREAQTGVAWKGDEIILLCLNKYLGYDVGSKTEIMISKYNKADAIGF
jgi:hypothetical protein